MGVIQQEQDMERKKRQNKDSSHTETEIAPAHALSVHHSTVLCCRGGIVPHRSPSAGSAWGAGSPEVVLSSYSTAAPAQQHSTVWFSGMRPKLDRPSLS
jgi:hypothetical protein